MAPRESFIKECPRRWSYPAFEDLKKRWKVSIATLVRRAYDLGCISKSAYTTANIELRKQLNEEGGEKAEWETERPVMIQQSLDLLSDKTSLNEMAHLVGVQTPDLYELLRPSVDEALLEELSNRKGQDEPDQIVTLKDEESKGVK
jgi:Zn-dependent peptidase ImmA (M78 family)